MIFKHTNKDGILDNIDDIADMLACDIADELRLHTTMTLTDYREFIGKANQILKILAVTRDIFEDFYGVKPLEEEEEEEEDILKGNNEYSEG